MSGLDSSPRATGEESLSPLEQEVLDEYVRLAGNLGDVSPQFIPFDEILCSLLSAYPNHVSHLMTRSKKKEEPY